MKIINLLWFSAESLGQIINHLSRFTVTASSCNLLHLDLTKKKTISLNDRKIKIEMP